jgi:membrane-bound lytic murein transglycosylase MltF
LNNPGLLLRVALLIPCCGLLATCAPQNGLLRNPLTPTIAANAGVADPVQRLDEALRWQVPLRGSENLGSLFISALGPAVMIPAPLARRAPQQLDFQALSQFADDIRDLFPRYKPLFQKAASRYGVDWRLLAAVGYQESHWDADAVSPRGVRGLMMLTQETADEIGVIDRADPAEAIDGGARYLQAIYQSLPGSIKGADRSWMALAAYNLGLSHVLDARALVAEQGGNANAWPELRELLPGLNRLDDPRFRYARGGETVIFVDNVRFYYEALRLLSPRDDRFSLRRQIDPAEPGV